MNTNTKGNTMGDYNTRPANIKAAYVPGNDGRFPGLALHLDHGPLAGLNTEVIDTLLGAREGWYVVFESKRSTYQVPIAGTAWTEVDGRARCEVHMRGAVDGCDEVRVIEFRQHPRPVAPRFNSGSILDD